MRRIIFILSMLLALPLWAQVSNPSIVLVSSAPSGSCTSNLPDQQVVTTGVLYICQSGTWAQSGISLPAGSANATTPGTNATNWTTVQAHVAHVCAEDYLYLDSAHGGTDYGVAINGADAAIKTAAYEHAVITLCSPGSHKTWTPAVIDWAIFLEAQNTQLVPQSGGASGIWGETPVTLSGCTLTAGSETASCPSITGVTASMAIGGLGLYDTTYVNGTPSGTSIPLALPANLSIDCVVTNASETVAGCSSLRGVAVGQTVTGYGIPASTTITAINYGQASATATQGLTLSANATEGSTTPISLTLASGSTWTANLTAEAVAPVITFAYNSAAPTNAFHQNIGAGMDGVWIADPGFNANSSARTLTGVQGVQIYGHDHFNSSNLRVDNLEGSAIILGGGGNVPSALLYGPVRESNFGPMQLSNDGDYSTGQPVREVMTPYDDDNSGSDEINTIGFTDFHAICPYAEATTIGTFNPSHTGTNGPRLFKDEGNSQEEGCSVTGVNMGAPVNITHIIQANDIYVSGTIHNVPGYGKALFRVDTAQTLAVNTQRLRVSNLPTTYTVAVTHGSTTVSYVSGGAGAFDVSGLWDGVGGQTVDGTLCTTGSPCNVYLAPSGAVTSTTSLTLAAPYFGTTNAAATLTLGAGGYYINVTGSLGTLEALGNTYNDPSTFDAALLDMPNGAVAWNVGSGFFSSPPVLLYDHGGPTFSTFTTTSQFLAPNGATGVPAYSWSAQTTDGMYRDGSGDYIFVAGDVAAMRYSASISALSADATWGWCWASTGLSAIDTCMWRESAQVVDIGTTTGKNASGQLHLGSVRFGSYTVATLPSASTLASGAIVVVTDATTFTPGTCVGGGGDTTTAISNGTSWVCQ